MKSILCCELSESTMSKLRYSGLIFLFILAEVTCILVINRMVNDPNSDRLVMPFIYEALFIDHLDLAGWNFSKAPQFFPDMPIYFFLRWISQDPGYSLSLYIGVLIVIIILLSRHLLSLLDLTDEDKYFYLTLATLWLASLFSYELIVSERLWPNFHGGVLVTGFGLVVLCARSVGGRLNKPLVIFFIHLILSTLVITSDKTIISQFLFPLSATFFVCTVFRIVSWQVSLPTIGAYLSGWFLSRQIIDYLRNTLFFSLSPTSTTIAFDLDIFIRAFNDLVSVIQYRYLEYGTAAICLLCCMLILFHHRHIFIFWKKQQESLGGPRKIVIFLAVFFLCQTVSMPMAVLLIGRWGGPEHIRYLSAAWYYSPIIIACFLAVYAKKTCSFRRWRGGLMAIVAVTTTCYAWGTWEDANDFTLRLPYHVEVGCVDRIAIRHNVRYGYSDYWLAKKITQLSATGLWLNQWTHGLSKQPWLNHNDWYDRTPEPGGDEPVLIITRDLNKEDIYEKYGAPTRKYTCPFIEDVFLYDKQLSYL